MKKNQRPAMERQTAREKLRLLSDKGLLQISPRPYIAWTPHPRQAEFLKLSCEEALYGGAAGGGKTQALLMWLTEGIKDPRYAGIIFRRTNPQLSKADGLIARSRELCIPVGGQFKESGNTWTFPSGARVELGILQYDKDVENYQGAAYTRIAFDELTQFSEYQYTYLFSRLGRTDIGIRPGMRAASNPGGLGHAWVKSRFVSQDAIDAVKRLGMYEPSPPGVFWKNGRAFVPSRVADNPSLNRMDYANRLATHLDPVTRARLLNGDWSVAQEGRIKDHWFRWYTMQGDYYRLEPPDYARHTSSREVLLSGTCQRMTIVDAAATSEEVARRERQKPPSYSAIVTLDITPKGQYLVRDVRRGLWDFPELRANVEAVADSWRPAWIGIEDEKTGRALLQTLRHRYNTRPLATEGKDKLTRAAQFLNMLEQGQVFFPDHSVPGTGWMAAMKDECLLWTGHPDETSDQIDCLAYACRERQRQEPLTIELAVPIYGPGGFF